MQRIHLIERRDLHNIKRDYDISCPIKKHKIDSVSVDLWVKEMQRLSANDNPVLLYQEQTVQQDFILVIMSHFQQKMLQKFGSNTICIDGTHGLNAYNFMLYSLLILDENNEGMPVAFCFSNRGTQGTYEQFFLAVKSRIGVLGVKIFMSDAESAFYNAWCNVMKPARKQLLCHWHIHKNWTENISKVKDQRKRETVLQALNAIISEVDEENFRKELETLLDNLKNDTDTVEFHDYFMRQYIPKVECWATCFRQGTQIHTNMHMEAFHKTIKYSYFEGRTVHRLDEAIYGLMQFIRDKKFERTIKKLKKREPRKCLEIEKSHKLAAEKKDSIIITCMEDKKWVSTSQGDASKTYIITQVCDGPPCCNLKCKICSVCLHMYHCSCPNNLIQINICKHIHRLCLANEDVHSQSLEEILEPADDPPFPIENEEMEMPVMEGPPSSTAEKTQIETKLQYLLQLNKQEELDENTAKMVNSHLDKAISLYCLDKKKKKTASRKKITKQEFFSTKKRHSGKVKENQSISNVAKSITQKELQKGVEEMLHIHRGSDHTY